MGKTTVYSRHFDSLITRNNDLLAADVEQDCIELYRLR